MKAVGVWGAALQLVVGLGGCADDPPSEPLSLGQRSDASVEVDGGTRAGDGGSTASERDAAQNTEPLGPGLLWPLDCVPGETCRGMGYPDVDGDGKAFDCSAPGYAGHEGTDIPVSRERMLEGVDVYAAADGEVLWVFDGKYDDCPNDDEPDCIDPTEPLKPGASQGTTVCTELGPYCQGGPQSGHCYWCFAGGNVVIIRHHDTPGVFATRYDHLRKGSILVQPGDHVRAGDKIGLVGSAGRSTGPHLHFEVWGATYYDPVEPWVGECGPNTAESLWHRDPPWAP